MGVRKLSVALEAQVAKSAVASAARQGLSFSAWLSRAAESALAVEDGLFAVAEWEAEHGGFSPEELAAADAVLDRARARGRRGGASRR